MGINISHLLSKKTFLPLFIVQFFGAFNDNAFKLAMLTLISYFLSSTQAQSEVNQALAAGLYILPFFIFSPIAGQLADAMDKAQIIRIVKIFELILMMIGGLGLYIGYISLMMVVLVGMGIHSTFFGPIKYAILPEHLPKKELLAATSLIESSTFLAILLGTTLGALSIGGAKAGTLQAIALTMAAAIIGFIASFYIPPALPQTENAHLNLNMIYAAKGMFKKIFKNKKIVYALLAISWFWLVGAVILTKLPDYANYVLKAKTTVFALFLALFSIGVACGSLLINSILKGKISVQYVPLSLMLLSIFLGDLYWATPTQNQAHSSIWMFFTSFAYIRIMMDLFLLALCGGLFIVPLYSYLQVGSEAAFRGRTIAVNNILNAAFMVCGSLFVMLLIMLDVSIPGVFLVMGILNAFAAVVLWCTRLD